MKDQSRMGGSLSWAVVAWAAVAPLGCSSERTSGSDDVGVIQLALRTPPDVGCVRLQFIGERQVTKDLPGGTETTTRLAGLPTGEVLVQGAAYASACGQGQPLWLSDPLTVLLAGGQPIAVQLVFRRNGIADVSGTFVEEGSCPGTPVLDQANLLSSGNQGLSPSQSVGQTFQPSRSGFLAGIEVALEGCSALPEDTVRMELMEVGSNSSISLGGVTLTGAGLPGPGRCGVVPAPLSPTAQGTGYFDFASQCLALSSAKTYAFLLTGGARGGCDQTAHLCLDSNARPCVNDRECERQFIVGDSHSDAYVGGTALANGAPVSSCDLAFKVLLLTTP